MCAQAHKHGSREREVHIDGDIMIRLLIEEEFQRGMNLFCSWICLKKHR